MNNTRRDFIKKSALLGVAGISIPHTTFAEEKNNIQFNTGVYENRPKVLFFDVNETLLDLTAMKNSVGKALGNRKDLLPLWFSAMIHHSLVMTTARQYAGFAEIGVACLEMIALNNGIKLSKEAAKKAIVDPIRSLPTHPEVKSALKKLKNDGFKLVSLTNSSYKGVETQFKNAGIIDLFDDRLSVETIGKFKPHTDVYDWAARKMNIKSEECMLIAAHGWDIAGALWANWRAAFIQRAGAQLFPLAPKPEINEKNLALITEKLMLLK